MNGSARTSHLESSMVGATASSATDRESKACSPGSSAWTNLSNLTDVCWRSISRDNITTWYGRTENSRIFDPDDHSHIFSWLICESYDDKGNAVVYEYVPEDSRRVDASQANEANRTEASRAANRYIKSIKYGNRTPNRDPQWQATDPATLPKDNWMFEVVFDYEEGHYEELPLDPTRPEAEQHRYVEARLDRRRAIRGLRHGSFFVLPGRLRGPHLPPLPPGADVPPLPG